ISHHPPASVSSQCVWLVLKAEFEHVSKDSCNTITEKKNPTLSAYPESFHLLKKKKHTNLVCFFLPKF
ncbi:hypothetical protein, partial [Vibrio sp. YT-19(2023)]|uniref:hypothetical protein n=1 Tax=Vibrio sp. YT-19(2023) TaxID=3074710 RepID=UPI0029649BF5